MLLYDLSSGQHPELTTPNRRVGPIRLAGTFLPNWIDSLIPCWSESRHAFGPLFTDPDTRATGRDCYRCGKHFPAPVPDGREVILDPIPVVEQPAVHHGFFDFLRGGRARMHVR